MTFSDKMQIFFKEWNISALNLQTFRRHCYIIYELQDNLTGIDMSVMTQIRMMIIIINLLKKYNNTIGCASYIKTCIFYQSYKY